LVEDEVDHRILLQQALGRLVPEVHVSEAATVAEARSWVEGRASEGPLDGGLVILDLTLPGPPGFDLLEWMRSAEPYKAVPVVVLTASENSVDAEHAFNLGVTGYFQKPSDFRQYLTTFRRVFEIAEQARQRESPGSEPESG